DRNLTGAEIELVTLSHREDRLRTLLASERDQFDYVLIDCPPSLGLLTLNALVAADAVLIPLHCEYFALEGLADLVGTIRRVRAALNPALDIEGVLLTMCDERTNLGQQVAADVRRVFKEKVFRTVIPRTVRPGRAPQRPPNAVGMAHGDTKPADHALCKNALPSDKASARSCPMRPSPYTRRRLMPTSTGSHRMSFSPEYKPTTRACSNWRGRSKRTVSSSRSSSGGSAIALRSSRVSDAGAPRSSPASFVSSSSCATSRPGRRNHFSRWR